MIVLIHFAEARAVQPPGVYNTKPDSTQESLAARPRRRASVMAFLPAPAAVLETRTPMRGTRAWPAHDYRRG